LQLLHPAVAVAEAEAVVADTGNNMLAVAGKHSTAAVVVPDCLVVGKPGIAVAAPG
jgi:hypothetical protein